MPVKENDLLEACNMPSQLRGFWLDKMSKIVKQKDFLHVMGRIYSCCLYNYVKSLDFGIFYDL